MSNRNGRLIVFAGNAHPRLAGDIADELGIEIGKVEVGTFADGETKITIQDNVRGHDVFIVQPTCSPVNHNLMDLLLMIDACRRASARRITAVIPYYGYARQDRKTRGREPISAKLVANLLTTSGAERVLTMDLHAGQIQGFFDIPVDNLVAVPILAEHLGHLDIKAPVVVSPDLGGVGRARSLADRLGLGASIAVIDKRRPEPNQLEVMSIIGNVEGRDAIIVDDLLDTGGTLVQGARALMDHGASSVRACVTHPLLSGEAPTILAGGPLQSLMVTDTIPISRDVSHLPLKVLSVAPLLAQAIIRIHEDRSISALFR